MIAVAFEGQELGEHGFHYLLNHAAFVKALPVLDVHIVDDIGVLHVCHDLANKVQGNHSVLRGIDSWFTRLARFFCQSLEYPDE